MSDRSPKSNRNSQGHFGPGNSGNPRPHNVLSEDERQWKASAEQEIRDHRRLEKTMRELVEARTPVLMVKAFDQAVHDESVVAPLLTLLAEQQRARNIAAEAGLMASRSPSNSTH